MTLSESRSQALACVSIRFMILLVYPCRSIVKSVSS
jgi:hypothetical protein